MFVLSVMELHNSSTPLSWAPHLMWEMWTCLSKNSFLKNLEYVFSMFTPSKGTQRVCMFVMNVLALLGTSCSLVIFFLLFTLCHASGVAKQDHNIIIIIIIIIIHVKVGKFIFSKGSSQVGFQEKWFIYSFLPLLWTKCYFNIFLVFDYLLYQCHQARAANNGQSTDNLLSNIGFVRSIP